MRSKSKKSSRTSTSRAPKCPVIFLDRTFGAYKLAAELHRMGFRKIEVHKRWFKDKEHDEVWITRVGLKNWRIFTQDKELETRHHDAIVAGNAGVFILSNTKPREGCAKWVEMIATCRLRIVHAAIHARRPFVARISYDGKLYKIRHLMPRQKVIDITLETEQEAQAVGMS